MPVAKVANHKHCANCGKAIPPEQETCSADCSEEIEEENSRRKKMMYITYGLMFVALILVLVGPLFLQ